MCFQVEFRNKESFSSILTRNLTRNAKVFGWKIAINGKKERSKNCARFLLTIKREEEKSWINKMLKKEKPMMTVAAIIEQAQSRWMDQHPLQVYNRAFPGSYCKYYCIFVYVHLFLHHHHRSCTGKPCYLTSPRLLVFRLKVQRTQLSVLRWMNERASKRKIVCNPIMCTWQYSQECTAHVWLCVPLVWCPQFQNNIKRETFSAFFLLENRREIHNLS